MAQTDGNGTNGNGHRTRAALRDEIYRPAMFVLWFIVAGMNAWALNELIGQGRSQAISNAAIVELVKDGNDRETRLRGIEGRVTSLESWRDFMAGVE